MNIEERVRSFAETAGRMEKEQAEDYLWETLALLQGRTFTTSGRGKTSGVEFTYSIKLDKDGRPGGEMFISTKEKSITRASVMMGYWRALEIQAAAGRVSGPKKIGTFGASYIYPLFLALGVITR